MFKKTYKNRHKTKYNKSKYRKNKYRKNKRHHTTKRTYKGGSNYFNNSCTYGDTQTDPNLSIYNTRQLDLFPYNVNPYLKPLPITH